MEDNFWRINVNTYDVLSLYVSFDTGIELCLGKPLDDSLLHVIHSEVQQLSDSLGVHKDREEKDVKSICSTLSLFKSEFDRAIRSLEEQQSSLKTGCEELRSRQDILQEVMSTNDKEQQERLRTSELYCKMRQEQVENLCIELEVKRVAMQRDLDILRTKIESLATSDDFKQVVFDAPEQNKWFTGRGKEVNLLEKRLPFESDSGLKMAAICGLGGCGKTTLAAHYAWKHRQEYEGGVYWISMEDDRKLENSMNDLAFRLGMLAESFDLTLSKVLTWITKRKLPWLLVLDDVDQLNLSEQMHKVLSGRWKKQASGHILLTTRREPKEVCESISMEPSCCVGVFAFSEDEAKSFLVGRSGVTDATKQELALDELVRELGCLPLALEQAGAHIKALQCPINTYLQEYKIQRLKLLNQHPRAKPLWEYESESRLAVHTTWHLNFEYVRKSPHGEVASSFVEAAAFLSAEEIQAELINNQLLPTVDPRHEKFNLMMKKQIVEILTKFSLFQKKNWNSLGLHRLVQEVIRNSLTTEKITSSLLRAARILHQSLRDCPSPDQILADITASTPEQPSISVVNPSLFYLWSKLTSHATEIQQHLKSLLGNDDIEREVKAVALTREVSRVVYENAVQLSVLGHQEAAKEAERFALQILDSCQSDPLTVTLEDLRKLFPHTLPLPQVVQRIILYSSRPPVDNQRFENDEELKGVAIDSIRLEGNAFFKEGRFMEAVDKYTQAIEENKGTTDPDPRLFINRATAYLKVESFEESLRDAEEYIKIMPKCWKGYTRKALALNGIGRRIPALCSAAIAYYHEEKCCRRYEAFYSVFKELDGNWTVIDSSETLDIALTLNQNSCSRKDVLLLQSGEYVTNRGGFISQTNLVTVSHAEGATITSDQLLLRNDCFIDHINFKTKNGVVVLPYGKVDFINCKFQCTSVERQAIQVSGTATLVICEISNSKGGGMVVGGPKSLATLVKCHISGNGSKPMHSAGLKVLDGGRLIVQECLVHGNTEGIHVDATCPEGVVARELTLTRSEIYDNKNVGIVVAGVPKASPSPFVTIQENKIYHNGGYGVLVSQCANNVRFQRNMVFENFWWGVWVQCNSGGYYEGNEICNNKMGGIRVGKQSPGKPVCVVENNVIHDNCGPAFHEGLRYFEFYSFPDELQPLFMKQFFKNFEKVHSAQTMKAPLTNQSDLKVDREISLPNTVQALFNFNNQCFQNENMRNHAQKAAAKASCAYCFRSDTVLKSCKRCMTAKYCGKECQTKHWGRHKFICQAVGQKNVIEVSIPYYPPPPGQVYVSVSSTNPGLEPTGPAFAPSPPIDGTRFIVKLQTYEGLMDNIECLDGRGYASDDYNPEKARIAVYDRSRYVDFTTAGQPRLFHLIMECGIVASSMYLSKKLYCWAAYKDGEIKTLRIFTHELPPVQKW